MPRPDNRFERLYPGRVAGVDEVGRGPLAGPVMAAAVVFTHPVPLGVACLIDDSKRLSRPRREAALANLHTLRRSGGVQIALGAASVREIEILNILHASLLAMRRAVLRLPVPPDQVLVDGNRAPILPCPVRCIVGGDGISISIAAASIVAKVVRDRGMTRLGRRYPHYGWETNSGYGTQAHRTALGRYGPTAYHRKYFIVKLCGS